MTSKTMSRAASVLSLDEKTRARPASLLDHRTSLDEQTPIMRATRPGSTVIMSRHRLKTSVPAYGAYIPSIVLEVAYGQAALDGI